MLSDREKDIVYKPRGGDEMDRALQHKARIYKYSDLCEIAKKMGGNSAKMLSKMFQESNWNIILLQNPNDMSSGHWVAVARKPQAKEMYFFSTYGGKPDAEKIEWLQPESLKRSKQDLNIFNDGLRTMQKHGWEIHYNDHPYQVTGDKTATCGIYAAAFLRSGKNPDEFFEDTKRVKEYTGKDPAIFYFGKYFR